MEIWLGNHIATLRDMSLQYDMEIKLTHSPCFVVDVYGNVSDSSDDAGKIGECKSMKTSKPVYGDKDEVIIQVISEYLNYTRFKYDTLYILSIEQRENKQVIIRCCHSSELK